MDRPAIHAAEDFVQAGYPRDVEALLIVELDGPEVEVDYLIARVEEIARANRRVSVRVSRTRTSACVLGRAQGGVPGGRPHLARLLLHGRHDPARPLPEVLADGGDVARYGLRVANVFHAGDGNLHPLILYDANNAGRAGEGRGIRRRDPEALRRGRRRADRRARRRRREARPDGHMFSDDDLKQQQRVKCAFDPKQLLNPGKVFPTAPLRRARPRACPSRPDAVPRYPAFLGGRSNVPEVHLALRQRLDVTVRSRPASRRLCRAVMIFRGQSMPGRLRRTMHDRAFQGGLRRAGSGTGRLGGCRAAPVGSRRRRQQARLRPAGQRGPSLDLRR